MYLNHPASGFRGSEVSWHCHHRARRSARLSRRQGVTMRWVSLPPHGDPSHPRGFVVGSSAARPTFRADLGSERTFPASQPRPGDHYFVEVTTAVVRAGMPRVDVHLQERATPREGLAGLVREARRRLLLGVQDPEGWWLAAIYG